MEFGRISARKWPKVATENSAHTHTIFPFWSTTRAAHGTRELAEKRTFSDEITHYSEGAAAAAAEPSRIFLLPQSRERQNVSEYAYD